MSRIDIMVHTDVDTGSRIAKKVHNVFVGQQIYINNSILINQKSFSDSDGTPPGKTVSILVFEDECPDKIKLKLDMRKVYDILLEEMKHE